MDNAAGPGRLQRLLLMDGGKVEMDLGGSAARTRCLLRREQRQQKQTQDGDCVYFLLGAACVCLLEQLTCTCSRNVFMTSGSRVVQTPLNPAVMCNRNRAEG
jgi:hypothetical protein